MPLDPVGNEKGAALVIILAFVVLLTGLVVAFFTHAAIERQVSNSSSSQTKADILSQSALEMIVGDLKQEIVNGSTVSTQVSGLAIYTPTSNANMLPQQSGIPAGAPVPPIPNLVRRSVRSDQMVMPGIGSRASAVNSTADPSVNGRTVKLARWNSHYLIPRHDTGNTIDSTPISPLNAASSESYGFTPPDWVMVTKTGPQVLTAPDFTTIGRYAYAIYDEGGLLDINVAGYPSGTTQTQYGLKGFLAFADLTALPYAFPQSPRVDQIVGWRNYASVQPGAAFDTQPTSYTFDAAAATRYYHSVLGATNGFLTVNPRPYPFPATVSSRTDQMFTSRQALLRFRRATAASGGQALSQNLLQYLGTFSRELNAPSWGPDRNAKDIDPANGLSSFTYKDSRDADATVNRFLPNVRATATKTIASYHDDGSPYTYKINAGEPLVKRRFPLNRLNWLGPNGPQNGGTAENIQACFGLAWGTGMTDDGRSIPLWQYVGPVGATEQGSIETLAQAAAENREPNFFELLQAGILSGSLAVDGGPGGGSADVDATFPSIHQRDPVLQVLRIGASIIDQYDEDSYPTLIEYQPAQNVKWQATGVENLPYLYSFMGVAGKSLDDPTHNLAAYYLFGLWNPQQGTPTSPRPAIRVRIQGSVGLHNHLGAMPADPVWGQPGTRISLNDTVLLTTSAGHGVNGFSDPGLLTAADADTAPASGAPGWVIGPLMGGTVSKSSSGASYLCYRLPDFPLDIARTSDTRDEALSFHHSCDAANPFRYVLEYQASSGDWIPYHYNTGLNDSSTWLKNDPTLAVTAIQFAGNNAPFRIKRLFDFNKTGNTPKPAFNTCPLYLAVDPRSLRFNQWRYDRSGLSSYGACENFAAVPALWTTAMGSHADDFVCGAGGGCSGSGESISPQAAALIPSRFGDFYEPACLARNNNIANGLPNNASPYSSYLDRDGVQRTGDSGLFPPSTTAAGGAAGGNPYQTSTQRVADRPIVLNRPFRSVAELGYVFRDDPWRSLDFFSRTSADAGLLDLFTVGKESTDMTAGRVNLNTRNSAVLAAVLNGTLADIIGGKEIGKASTLASSLVAYTTSSSGPLVNKSDLATRFCPALDSSDFSGTDAQNVKARREALVRALADAGQTRTWNLMIDVIAQAGRYPPGANDLAQFAVEGERRYWLHIAIDRFTGEIIDRQLELVTE